MVLGTSWCTIVRWVTGWMLRQLECSSGLLKVDSKICLVGGFILMFRCDENRWLSVVSQIREHQNELEDDWNLRAHAINLLFMVALRHWEYQPCIMCSCTSDLIRWVMPFVIHVCKGKMALRTARGGLTKDYCASKSMVSD